MSPILRFPKDVEAALLREALLSPVTIVSLRALQLSSELDVKRAWLKARNGKSGAGIVIGIPTLDHQVPNVDGPEREMLLPVSVFEQPSLNAMASTGTQLDAETIVDYVEAILARLQIEGLGTLYSQGVMPNLETQAGVLRYDLIFAATVPRAPLGRCVLPDYSCPAQTVTFTNVTAGAQILYTTDATFPGRDAATGQLLGTTLVYSAPFTVASGAVVRWAAQKSGLVGSDTGEITVS
jgi:Chitobiase/beta-hexosaminidase C-terminal domain